MKRIKLFIVFGLFVITFIVLVSAKSGNENEKICKSYKDISSFGVSDFINMDLGIIAYFPTEQDWKQIGNKIKFVPLDSLRYIDSLDIHRLADTLYVKIYSQNYAYQSSNTYKIAMNTNKSTDTLMIFKFEFDFKIKDIIADVRSFRVKNFTVNYITEQNVINIDKRILINKNYR